jgi:pyruvate/2-oxoglutarate/acetoin dehydrogenase E1 component/TPP-dependent pyruvate/acetoin dehydrogenase alpha subunit
MYLEEIEVLVDKKSELTETLNDYYLAFLSRQLSILGRREVHNGRAHFGIFGDGKEVVQIALAKTFRKGDWRSGYYRDQTLMLALGLLEPEEFFAMIYGDTDVKKNPSTGGRNFNNHYCTQNIDSEGNISDHSSKFNSASDLSPTAGQMPRLLGLAQASKIARHNPGIQKVIASNVTGNEVAFGTIGDSSTSEGMFFETINAACVMQVPIAVTIYDDGYGISVPVELQTAKASISKALKGFEKSGKDEGCLIYQCHGWDYPALISLFERAINECREKQIPVVFHIDELTQPTGHSSSGSQERYKDQKRLKWEADNDALFKFREYLLNSGKADIETIVTIEKQAEKRARLARDNAWKQFSGSFEVEYFALEQLISEIDRIHSDGDNNLSEMKNIKHKIFPTRRSYLSFAKRVLYEIHNINDLSDQKSELQTWIENFQERSSKFYNKQLYRDGKDSVLNVSGIKPLYDDVPEMLNGAEILNQNFEKLFMKHPTMITFGEDTGKLGDVNQGMKGMQAKFGSDRVSDTGIREATIIGQGIGLAMRGFRPIAEIQYLDYLIYALSSLSDDLATLQYRTMGKQAAPLIIRTRGHQLQGIWHAGSPIGMLLGSLRGIYLCVPRDMTQAAGFYNTLLEANDPALVIEPLKSYSLKEPMPHNIGDFRVPLGIPEVIEEGSDITIVTYGWNVHHAQKAAHLLAEHKISAEVIDVQTLIPFDINHRILESVKKTNKVLFVDEDVPGGATAYMMQKVMEEQKVFNYLETSPRTLTAMEHRPAYGIDGEYFSKPNVELIFETVYEMMREVDSERYSEIYNRNSIAN